MYDIVPLIAIARRLPEPGKTMMILHSTVRVSKHHNETHDTMGRNPEYSFADRVYLQLSNN